MADTKEGQWLMSFDLASAKYANQHELESAKVWRQRRFIQTWKVATAIEDGRVE
jgi:hypothetical protein